MNLELEEIKGQLIQICRRNYHAMCRLYGKAVDRNLSVTLRNQLCEETWHFSSNISRPEVLLSYNFVERVPIAHKLGLV